MIEILVIYFIASSLIYSKYGPLWVAGQGALLAFLTATLIGLGFFGFISIWTVMFTLLPVLVAIPVTMAIQTAWSFYWKMLSKNL